MRPIFILLLLCSAAFAAGCVSDATAIIVSEQGTLIIAAIGLMVIVIAAAYALGSAMNNANYTLFAKEELYHLGFSVLMLISFSGIVLVCCTIMDYFMSTTFSYLGTGSSCYASGTSSIQSASECYVNRMTITARAMGERYVQNHIDALMDSTYSYSIQVPMMNYFITVPGSYKRIVSNEYDMVLNSFILPAMMSISMQKLAVDFINENIVRWVLPIALFLRILPPTRQMGDILIALCLGLYVIVPVMYTFNLAMYDVTLPECKNSYQAACDFAVDGGSCAPSTCSNADGFWMVALLIPQAIFLPNLTIAILVTFMASIHKALRVIG